MCVIKSEEEGIDPEKTKKTKRKKLLMKKEFGVTTDRLSINKHKKQQSNQREEKVYWDLSFDRLNTAHALPYSPHTHTPIICICNMYNIRQCAQRPSSMCWRRVWAVGDWGLGTEIDGAGRMLDGYLITTHSHTNTVIPKLGSSVFKSGHNNAKLLAASILILVCWSRWLVGESRDWEHA